MSVCREAEPARAKARSTVEGAEGPAGGGEVLTRHTKAPNVLRPVQVVRVQETLISEIPPEWVDCEGDKAADSREMSQRTEAQSR